VATAAGSPARRRGHDAELEDLERFAHYPSLVGRVAVVTGGATGIGASIVAHLCAQRARVAFLDIAESEGRALATDLAAQGRPEPLPVPCDVRDIDALRTALAQITQMLGPPSVLVNNASSDRRTHRDDISPQEWDDLLAVNLRPHFFAIQALAPAMVVQGGGSIVNLGSISAHADFVDLAGYIAAKAAIEGLTRTMARELGPANIRVNCVVPGWVMTDRQRGTVVTPEDLAALEAKQSLKVRLLPADVARLVLWLTADDSRAATGQRWVVDGGWM